MAKKVTLDNLASEIEKILDEYGDEVDDKLDEITKRIGQKGRDDICPGVRQDVRL